MEQTRTVSVARTTGASKVAFQRACVLGLGHIGLPTATLLARAGVKVTGVDIDQRVVKRVLAGRSHLNEPDLDNWVSEAVRTGYLSPRSKAEPADVFIICVPTPVTDDKRADLRAVASATEAIAPHLRPGNLVILESTCPPGTTQGVVSSILSRSGLEPGRDFFLAYCPERVLPGNMLRELIMNDRIVGGIDPASAERARQVYATFVQGELHITDAITAEMVKLAENTFRDVNIALANEVAGLCEHLGLDAWEVIGLANRHPRVKYLMPGPGVGGHCIPVDPWFLIELAPSRTRLMQTSRDINDGQPGRVAAMIAETVGHIRKPSITVLGLAYKGNSGDARESPSHALIERLADAGYRVRAYDPLASNGHTQGLVVAETLEEACAGSDCIVLMTDHGHFKEIDPAALAPIVRSAHLIDTRNFFDRDQWARAGFRVRVLGNGKTYQERR